MSRKTQAAEVTQSQLGKRTEVCGHQAAPHDRSPYRILKGLHVFHMWLPPLQSLPLHYGYLGMFGGKWLKVTYMLMHACVFHEGVFNFLWLLVLVLNFSSFHFCVVSGGVFLKKGN